MVFSFILFCLISCAYSETLLSVGNVNGNETYQYYSFYLDSSASIIKIQYTPLTYYGWANIYVGPPGTNVTIANSDWVSYNSWSSYSTQLLTISPCDTYYSTGSDYYVMIDIQYFGAYNLTISRVTHTCLTYISDSSIPSSYSSTLNYNSWLYFNLYTSYNYYWYAFQLTQTNYETYLYIGYSYYPSTSSYELASTYYDYSPTFYFNSTCGSNDPYVGVYCGNTDGCNFTISVSSYYSYFGSTCPQYISSSGNYYNYPLTTNFGFYWYFQIPITYSGYDLEISTYPSNSIIYVATTSYNNPGPNYYSYLSSYGDVTLKSYQISSLSYVYVAVFTSSNFYLYYSWKTSTTSSPTYTPPGSFSSSGCITQSTYETYSCTGDYRSQITVTAPSYGSPCFYLKAKSSYALVSCSYGTVYYSLCSDSQCYSCGSQNSISGCSKNDLFSQGPLLGYGSTYSCTCSDGSSLVVSLGLGILISMFFYFLQ